MKKKKVLIPAVILIIVFVFAVLGILEKQSTKNLKSIYFANLSLQTSTENTVIENSTSSQNKITTQTSTQKISYSNISEEILFYGDGCPHCANVENFIDNNGVLGQTSLIEKEVYNDKSNLNELSQKAGLCGINSNSLVVPFLWTGSQCILGDTPIIDYLKNQISK